MKTIEDTMKGISNDIVREIKSLAKMRMLSSNDRKVFRRLMIIASEYYKKKDCDINDLSKVMIINNHLYYILNKSCKECYKLEVNNSVVYDDELEYIVDFNINDTIKNIQKIKRI